MHEWEFDWKGNRGLMIWLRDLAPAFGIKVGGKTIRELMDEIQCAVSYSKARFVAKTTTKPSSSASMPTAVSETASPEVKVRTPPTESSLGHSMTPFPPKGTKG